MSPKIAHLGKHGIKIVAINSSKIEKARDIKEKNIVKDQVQ